VPGSCAPLLCRPLGGVRRTPRQLVAPHGTWGPTDQPVAVRGDRSRSGSRSVGRTVPDIEFGGVQRHALQGVGQRHGVFVRVSLLEILGSVSNGAMATPMTLIYKVLFPSLSTFETPPPTVSGRFFCASFLAHQNVPHVFRHLAYCWLHPPPAIFPLSLQDLPDGLLSRAALSLASHRRELHLRARSLTPAPHRADPV
jgi:hypothetical protein